MSTPKVKQFKAEPLQAANREPFGRPRQFAPNSQVNGSQQGLPGSNGLNSCSHTTVNNNTNNSTKPYGTREKGVIEKMLASYGFVQCTERRGRFFFHYSEYKGNLANLKVGDPVEFQESVDKRTGKPVAILIVKLSEVSCEAVGGKQFEGTVLSDIKSRNVGNNGGDFSSPSSELGRVTYEQGGETFFLPFANDDVESGQKVTVGDKVTFMIANDMGTGNLRARRLRKKSSPSDLYQGVVCSMKENFGFIERADVVKEIFFHFSEYEGDIEELSLGDDVEYGIQVRNNKDVAVNIHKIPPGSVVFEDVAKDVMRGRIKKTLKMNSVKKVNNDALIGRIVYETLNGPIEIVFGEKDPVGDFTMFVDDIVEFSIATDRRDKVQHATNIRLVDDTFFISKDKREKGFITTLKEGFGFIRCTDREARMFFHFSELLNGDHKLSLQDEVEFTVIPDPTNATRQVAVRIKVLPRGSIVVQSNSSLEKYIGTIQKEAGNLRSIQGSKDQDPGILMYEVEGTKQMIPYSSSVVDGNLPKLDEKVEFQISECQKNKTKVAINVRVVGRAPGRDKDRGYVVTLKEGFGFIETSDHEREIYFHFSNYEGDIETVEVGHEVEFQVCNKAGRVSAECIRRIANKSIQIGEVIPTILEGRITRGLHSQDSSEYFGIIQLTSDIEAEVPPTPTSAAPATPSTPGAFPFTSEFGTFYPFSIMSLVDKRETLLVRGDLVRFQLVEVPVGVANGSTNGKAEFLRSDSSSGAPTKKKWAYRVAPFRKFIHARIESINEMGGTLTYEAELGSRLTFSLKDVQDASELSVGDEVEFVVLALGGGQKTAINIQKATDRPRPERLLSRIKSVTDDQCPRAMAIRQPKGPDGSKGFKCPRKESTPVSHNNPPSAPLVEKIAKEDSETTKGLDMAGGDVMVADQVVAKNEEGEVFEGGHQVHRKEGSVM